jgi:uncharacterized caspase-like protein
MAEEREPDQGKFTGKLFQPNQNVDEIPADGKTVRTPAVQEGLRTDAREARKRSQGRHRAK